MTRTSGMLVGYLGLITGWTYDNVFLIVVGMVILVTEGTAYFKEREQDGGS